MSARLIDFAFGDTVPSKTWLEDMIARSHIRKASSCAWSVAKGGIHRVGVLVNVWRPAADETEYLIDTEVDWRDRIIFVACGLVDTDGTWTAFPGAESGIMAGSTNAPAVGYTGLGGSSYDLIPDVGTTLYLRVDATTGHLKVVVTPACGTENFTLSIMAIATEQLAQRSSPAAPPAVPYGTDGDPVEPIDLNALQDGAMLTQFRDADGTDPETDTLVASTLFPFGPAMTGKPPVPRVFYVERIRGKTGAYYNAGLMHRSQGVAPHRATEVRRQRVAGSIRCFGAREVMAAATVVLDDANDWRDRLILGVSRLHSHVTEDIRPGEANDDLHNTAYARKFTGYTGPGDDGTGSYLFHLDSANDVHIYADSTDGSLKVFNDSATRVTLTVMAYASFMLGPRTPRSA